MLTMHQFHLNTALVALAVLAIGCQGNGGSGSTGKLDVESDLVGRWQADADASRLLWGDDKELARRMSFSLEVEYEFRADKTMTASKGERSYDRDWSVKSKDANSIEVNILPDEDPGSKLIVLTFVFETKDRIIYSSNEVEGELVMTRVKK